MTAFNWFTEICFVFIILEKVHPSCVSFTAEHNVSAETYTNVTVVFGIANNCTPNASVRIVRVLDNNVFPPKPLCAIFHERGLCDQASVAGPCLCDARAGQYSVIKYVNNVTQTLHLLGELEDFDSFDRLITIVVDTTKSTSEGLNQNLAGKGIYTTTSNNFYKETTLQNQFDENKLYKLPLELLLIVFGTLIFAAIIALSIFVAILYRKKATTLTPQAHNFHHDSDALGAVLRELHRHEAAFEKTLERLPSRHHRPKTLLENTYEEVLADSCQVQDTVWVKVETSFSSCRSIFSLSRPDYFTVCNPSSYPVKSNEAADQSLRSANTLSESEQRYSCIDLTSVDTDYLYPVASPIQEVKPKTILKSSSIESDDHPYEI